MIQMGLELGCLTLCLATSGGDRWLLLSETQLPAALPCLGAGARQGSRCTQLPCGGAAVQPQERSWPSGRGDLSHWDRLWPRRVASLGASAGVRWAQGKGSSCAWAPPTPPQDPEAPKPTEALLLPPSSLNSQNLLSCWPLGCPNQDVVSRRLDRRAASWLPWGSASTIPGSWGLSLA